jgi:hypothetical protein
MPISEADCLRYEAECLDMAEDPAMAGQRARLLQLAKMWREMAIEKIAAPQTH